VAEKASETIVMPVLVPGKPYVEDVETRLRARQAMIHALAISSFFPAKNSELGFVVPKSGKSDVTKSYPTYGAPKEWLRPMKSIAYEWFSEEFKDPKKTKKLRRVLVMWLDDEAFYNQPWNQFAQMFSAFEGKGGALPKICIFGPATSGTLRKMIEHAAEMPGESDTPKAPDNSETPNNRVKKLLRTTHVYSSAASAADYILLSGTIANPSAFKSSKEFLESKLWASPDHKDDGFTFDRIILPDDLIVKTMREELSRRGINEDNDQMVIITEHDTYYARALRAAFLSKGDIFSEYYENVHSFQYLRGLDGKLPGDRDGENSKKSSSNADPSTNYSQTVTDRPDGLNQADYLRRLATQLEDLNQAEAKNGGIRAVGVLGSDIYDKLEILAALRSVLPRAQFFTNFLDARFSHPDELASTKNLIVVSTFGLTLHPDVQNGTPPFRDSSQAGLYLAVRRALDPGKHFLQTPKNFTPRIFEIGRTGPVDLSRESEALHPRPSDVEAVWIKNSLLYSLSPEKRAYVGIAALTCTVMALFFLGLSRNKAPTLYISFMLLLVLCMPHLQVNLFKLIGEHIGPFTRFVAACAAFAALMFLISLFHGTGRGSVQKK
jgi:hypothetical protein